MSVVDMHCDTIERLFEIRKRGEGDAKEEGLHKAESLLGNSGHLDLLRMKEGGYFLQNFALFVNLGTGEDPWEKVCALQALYQEELVKNNALIAPIFSYNDIKKNRAEKKMSAMLTLEEGAVCKGELSKLRSLYNMGVRMMTLTWNYPNEIGFPALDRKRREEKQLSFEDYFYKPDLSRGLTKKGFEFVAEMEKMGMIIDVSHLSDAGFYDVLHVTKKPFVASHSNARGVCRTVRNLSDDMIRKLAERGGVTGLNFYADFLKEVPVGSENPGDMDSVVRHAKYITNLGGIEVLGLGSDFDGIDTNQALPGAQSMECLWEALKQGGFTEGELDKIFCENVLRVYQEVL